MPSLEIAGTDACFPDGFDKCPLEKRSACVWRALCEIGYRDEQRRRGPQAPAKAASDIDVDAR